MTNRERTEAAMRDFGDPATRYRYLAMYSDDVRFHGYEGLTVGIDALREFYERFWTAFPDAHVNPEDWLEYQDRVTVRYTVHGTHTGPLRNIEPTGNRVALPGISILKFAHGLCVERWAVTDSLLLLSQIQRKPVSVV